MCCMAMDREMFILKKNNFSPCQAEWVADPFEPKSHSLIQNNMGPNFSNGLNLVTCEHSLTINCPDTVKFLNF